MVHLYHMVFRLTALGLCLLFFFKAHTQFLGGIPEIKNYTKEELRAGNQNWKIRQGKDDLIYAANNEGLLSFDGYQWILHKLPGGLAVRSIETGANGLLYVGSIDDFGYFRHDENGRFTYHSLKRFIPATDQSFGDIWSIVFYNDAVFFRSGSRIFRWHNGQMTVFRGANWKYLTVVQQQLFAQDQIAGLLKYRPEGWQPYSNAIRLPKGAQVITIISKREDSSLLLFTQNHGLFRLNKEGFFQVTNQQTNQFAHEIINAVIGLTQGRIAIATRSNGLYILDEQLNVIDHLTRNQGLFSNHIMTIYADKDQNLWLGLENGIDFVAYQHPIRKIYPDSNDRGAGYAAAFYENNLYLGTANGLYKAAVMVNGQQMTLQEAFQKVPGSKGQVWNLNVVNNQLWMAHHEGAFLVKDNRAIPIDQITGYWKFLPLNDVQPSPTVLAGSYKGVLWLSHPTNKQLYSSDLHSARFIEKTDNYVWISHPSRGLFRFDRWKSTPVIEPVKLTGQAALAKHLRIFSIDRNLVLSTDKGQFTYTAIGDSFATATVLNQLFPKLIVYYITQDNDGRIWISHDKSLAYVTGYPNNPQLHYLPEVTNKLLTNFENVTMLPNKLIIIGAESGFYVLDPLGYQQQEIVLQPRITQAKFATEGDSILYEGNLAQPSSQKYALYPGWRFLQFQFSAPAFTHQSSIEYSYMLQGYEKTWSAWSSKREKEYANLPPGTYTFKVKARSGSRIGQSIASLRVGVLPKWYQTLLFKGSIVVLAILFATWLYWQQHLKVKQRLIAFAKEQEHMLQHQQLELEKAEKELVKLQNQILANEISLKNAELASSAMHLVQKAEFIGKLHDELILLAKQPASENTPIELKKLAKSLGEADRIDAEWEVFEQHFDRVHGNFLDTTRRLFPQLSANELKLCAYLRINLSTKEISKLLNISKRGVDISRYRLRKKLGIANRQSLSQFLIEVTQTNTIN